MKGLLWICQLMHQRTKDRIFDLLGVGKLRDTLKGPVLVSHEPWYIVMQTIKH